MKEVNVKKSKTSREPSQPQNLIDNSSDKSLDDSKINLLNKKGSKTEIIPSSLRKTKQKTFIGA